jgi:hypothetical protein
VSLIARATLSLAALYVSQRPKNHENSRVEPRGRSLRFRRKRQQLLLFPTLTHICNYIPRKIPRNIAKGQLKEKKFRRGKKWSRLEKDKDIRSRKTETDWLFKYQKLIISSVTFMLRVIVQICIPPIILIYGN